MTDTTTSLDQARRIAVELENENARLRAELDSERRKSRFFDGEATDYAVEYGEALATIARVRAVLELGDTDHIEDDPPGEHDDAYNAGMDYVVDALRAALDGEQ